MTESRSNHRMSALVDNLTFPHTTISTYSIYPPCISKPILEDCTAGIQLPPPSDLHLTTSSPALSFGLSFHLRFTLAGRKTHDVASPNVSIGVCQAHQ